MVQCHAHIRSMSFTLMEMYLVSLLKCFMDFENIVKGLLIQLVFFLEFILVMQVVISN